MAAHGGAARDASDRIVANARRMHIRIVAASASGSLAHNTLMATNSTRPTESVRRAATPPDDVTTALDAIRRIVQALRVSARSAERRLGVSGAQLFVLHALADEPARSLNDLAARTYTHQSSVSVVVDRLAKRRLVSRSRSPQDGRRIVLELTPSGRSLLRASPEVAQIRLIHALRDLSRKDAHALARVMSHVVERMGIGEAPELFFEDGSAAARRRNLSKRARRVSRPR